MPSSVSSTVNPPEHLATATSEGVKGFLVGAARYGSVSLICHVLGTGLSPVYRGLTIQFKVFLQISAMTLGGCVWAEERVKEYENFMRRRNRALARSSRAWTELEERDRRSQRDKILGEGR